MREVDFLMGYKAFWQSQGNKKYFQDKDSDFRILNNNNR